ncbi:MAG: hypothetical protein WC343_00465 [Bacilli bacterium]|jgi:alpha-acetolactate decarboxylase
MRKRLSDIYVGRIEKKLVNNEKVFYSALNKKEEVSKINSHQINDREDIDNKIVSLFNSPNYVYKIKATITLKDQTTINKEIIGQSNGKLIAIDESLIDINDIRDISF